MTLTLNRTDVQNDINARYMMTVQTDEAMPPAGERDQAIEESFSSLVALIGHSVTNVDASDLTIEIRATSRRAPGQAGLKQAAHSYVVSSSLARIYYNMRMAEQAQVNAAVAQDDASTIDKILLTISRPAGWTGL